MDKERAEELLLNANYKFAKTMPQNPHWYTLRETWQNQEDFERVVQFIRNHGTKAKFFKTIYIYYHLDGYKYWTMGSPLNQTILINRAKCE